jgi:hypothetical protein
MKHHRRRQKLSAQAEVDTWPTILVWFTEVLENYPAMAIPRSYSTPEYKSRESVDKAIIPSPWWMSMLKEMAYLSGGVWSLEVTRNHLLITIFIIEVIFFAWKYEMFSL